MSCIYYKRTRRLKRKDTKVEVGEPIISIMKIDTDHRLNNEIEGNVYINIPEDEGNIDYQNYLAWVAEGNTPEPADE